MSATSIEWVRGDDGSDGHSINPIKFKLAVESAKPVLVNMCTKCSPGCANCYAETLTGRFWKKEWGEYPGYTAQALKRGEFVIDPSKLQEVLKRRKPTRYFWCDMSDMFHPSVGFDLVDQCFATMALTPQHTHLILTKRPERMAEYLTKTWLAADEKTEIDRRWVIEGQGWGMLKRPIELDDWPLPNVWLGTSCENQQTADERIPHLLECPAAVKFLSCEPLLGAIDLHAAFYRPRLGPEDSYKRRFSYPELGVSWAIVGGESGPGARPCNVNWVRSIVEQCKAAGVACFVKQLGPAPYQSCVDGDGKDCPDSRWPLLKPKDSKGGDISEFPKDLKVRQFPRLEAPTKH